MARVSKAQANKGKKVPKAQGGGDCKLFPKPLFNNPIRLPQINLDFLKRKEKPPKPKKEIPETPKETPRREIPSLPKAKIPSMDMNIKRRRFVPSFDESTTSEKKTPSSTSVTPGGSKVSPKEGPRRTTSSSAGKKPSGTPNKTVPNRSVRATPPSSRTTPGTYSKERKSPGQFKLKMEEYRRGGKVSRKSAPKVARAGAKVMRKSTAKACWGSKMKKK